MKPSSRSPGTDLSTSARVSRAIAIFASPPIWPHIEPEASRTMIALSAWAAVAHANMAAPARQARTRFMEPPIGNASSRGLHAARDRGLRQAEGCDALHIEEPPASAVDAVPDGKCLGDLPDFGEPAHHGLRPGFGQKVGETRP